jgi:GTP cyclohydrolase I
MSMVLSNVTVFSLCNLHDMVSIQTRIQVASA